MKKTLVLVVDRDNDFGIKGGVETPVIGVEGCSVAATALGISDPEDSDVNALFAAINIYKDLCSDHNQIVEVALICGDQKVGYRSDSAIIEELEDVLEKIRPDRVILVGDGAEDEYVYPIISSRIRIDSVRKVYVKQAPGIEGTVYILSKIMEDPGKRKRFIAPIGWIIMMVSLVYLVPSLMIWSNVATPLVAFMVGVAITLFAYNIPDRISEWKAKWGQKIRNGSITVTFLILAIVIYLAGFVYSFFSLESTYTYNYIQAAVWYIYNLMWFMIFGTMVYYLGEILEAYMDADALVFNKMTFCNSLLAIGLIIIGAFDMTLRYLDLSSVGSYMASAEIGAGILLAFLSVMLQHYVKSRKATLEEDGDAV